MIAEPEGSRARIGLHSQTSSMEASARVSRIFARVLGVWLASAVALAAVPVLVLPLSAVPLHRLAASAVGGAASVFVVGLPFCSLVAALRGARRGMRADRLVLAGLAVSVLACLVIAALTGNALPRAFAFLASGRQLEARQMLRLSSSASLCVLPLLRAVTGVLISRASVAPGRLLRAAQNAAAVLIGLVILVAIGSQNLLLPRVPPALLGLAPLFIAVVGVMVFAVLPLLRRVVDDAARRVSIGTI